MSNEDMHLLESQYPEIEVARGGNGNLLLVQLYKKSDGSVDRVPLMTEMSNALALAMKIIAIADDSFLNPIRPPMHDIKRKYMN